MKIFHSYIYSLIVVGLILSLFIFPKVSTAEIATVKDWIGLYRVGAGDLKTNTYTGCPSLDPVNKYCWAYTSSCTQTAGTVPQLARDGTPSPCSFALNPTPAPGISYVFRLYANNIESADALIAASALMLAAGTDSITPPPPLPSGKLYHIIGNLSLDHDITVNKTGVIFVDGNLYINTNLENTNTKTGLVFIVQGTIYINPGVDTINAFMISYGGFCSAWSGLECKDNLDSASQKQLTINGSVISLNPTIAPQFVRQKTTLTTASETINYQPKYLVILKDIFSRDLKIWQEVQ